MTWSRPHQGTPTLAELSLEANPGHWPRALVWVLHAQGHPKWRGNFPHWILGSHTPVHPYNPIQARSIREFDLRATSRDIPELVHNEWTRPRTQRARNARTNNPTVAFEGNTPRMADSMAHGIPLRPRYWRPSSVTALPHAGAQSSATDPPLSAGSAVAAPPAAPPCHGPPPPPPDSELPSPIGPPSTLGFSGPPGLAGPRSLLDQAASLSHAMESGRVSERYVRRTASAEEQPPVRDSDLAATDSIGDSAGAAMSAGTSPGMAPAAPPNAPVPAPVGDPVPAAAAATPATAAPIADPQDQWGQSYQPWSWHSAWASHPWSSNGSGSSWHNRSDPGCGSSPYDQ